MIDTHCHLDMPAFDHDREEVWQRARATGIRAAIIPAVEPESWSRTAALAKPNERFVAIGIHPQAVPELSREAVHQGVAVLANAARVHGAIAIGECGLDGAVDLTLGPMALQREVFAAHLEIARALDLPAVVHVYQAHGEAMSLLRSMKLRDPPGVLHSYSGSAELLKEYLAMGFFVSFAGAVTRPNAKKPIAAARAVPLSRLLLETDAPDQTPTNAPPSGANGRRCEPMHLPITVRALAALRGEDERTLIDATTRNACALFGLSLG